MTVVLDSSAVIALLWDEAGTDMVGHEIDGALMSSVNLAEVALRLARAEVNPRPIVDDLLELGLDVVDFTFDCSLQLMDLRVEEQRLGISLSLGDRCCLATAMHTRLPVLTADREWAVLDEVVEIRLIR